MNSLQLTEINPKPPSYKLGYWRPWNENSNFFESYMDYTKDKSLAKYGADVIGSYIGSASKEQIYAINNLGQKLGVGINILGNKIKDGLDNINENIINISDNLIYIHDEIEYVNRNLDILLQQQKISQYLLKDIIQILKIPDAEKERIYYIDKGVKYFVNAAKDNLFYRDALEMFLKAKMILKQDYFVLHKLGYIYLYADSLIDPKESINHFTDSARYAILELNNLSNGNDDENIEFNESNNSVELKSLIADCYDKTAFSHYILGNFNDAEMFQLESLKYISSAIYRFQLAKYQVRNNNANKAIENLDIAIDQDSSLVAAVFHDIDLMNDNLIIDFLYSKNKSLDTKIRNLIDHLNTIKSERAELLSKKISNAFKSYYKDRLIIYEATHKDYVELKSQKELCIFNISELSKTIKESLFITLSENSINESLINLNKALELHLEKMIKIYNITNELVQNDKVKIGSSYSGGIVFQIDPTGRNGLVFCIDSITKSFWGFKNKQIGTSKLLGTGKENTLLISKKANTNVFIENKRKLFFFNQKIVVTQKYDTAADLCLMLNINGYNDWFLPSIDELNLLFHSLNNEYKTKIPFRIWSSSEKSISSAFYFSFKSGKVGNEDKHNSLYFIPIRAF